MTGRLEEEPVLCFLRAAKREASLGTLWRLDALFPKVDQVTFGNFKVIKNGLNEMPPFYITVSWTATPLDYLKKGNIQ